MNHSENCYLQTCPVGCNAPLESTEYVLPEGALLRCTACGQMISQCTEAHYWESMQEFNDPQGTLPNLKSEARRFRRSKKFLDHIAVLLKQPPSQIRLLDVGCSSGAFLNTAVRLGFDAEGVVPGVMRAARTVPQDGGIIGFVGREWQRKGLPLAVEVAAALRKQRPKLELWVVGPEPREVEHLFRDWQGGYKLLGWRSDDRYLSELDLLLHPAKAEPYGMVVSEAMAARIPVVVSDACGAMAQVTTGRGRVLGLGAPLQEWLEAVEGELMRSEPVPGFIRGWDAVANEYEAIYANLKREKK